MLSVAAFAEGRYAQAFPSFGSERMGAPVALDLHVQAFKLAEELSLPVMVCMDGFILTHAVEQVDIPDQAEVDAFLPPYEPRQVLDPAEPVTIGAMGGAGGLRGGQVPHARQADAGARRHPGHRRRVRARRRRRPGRQPGAPWAPSRATSSGRARTRR
jgi:hypothetical protein